MNQPMGKSIDLSSIYTAKEMSERIGKNRNYLSQAYRHEKYSILNKFNYRRVGGTLIFSDDFTNDLSQLIGAKEASKLLNKNDRYFSEIYRLFPEKLLGIDYIIKGRTIIFTKKSVEKYAKRYL